MSSSTPPSRTVSPSRRGGGGPGPGSGSGGYVSLTPVSPAAPGTSTVAAGAVFAAVPSCLMPEVFTDGEDFEEYMTMPRVNNYEKNAELLNNVKLKLDLT